MIYKDETYDSGDVIRFLEHAIAYCDAQAGIAVHDPERVPDQQLSQDYQQAANVLSVIRDSRIDPDFAVQGEGSVYLLQPLTPAATEWIESNLPTDRTMFGSAVVVEWRYIAGIVHGIKGAGLAVR